MQNDLHNPQQLEPEQFGGPDGYRLLTQTEAAVLTDPESAKTQAATALREYLRPQLYNEGVMRWQPVTGPRFDESFTYRTAAPFMEEEEPETCIVCGEKEPCSHDFDDLDKPFPMIPGWLLSDKEFQEDTAAGINGTVGLCHGLAIASGWHSDLATGQLVPVNVAEKLLLIHSEISEACEGYRKNLPDDKLPHRSMIEVELVDAVIRIFDLAGALDLDIGNALIEKLLYNQQRADHKPENRREANGKKF